MAACERLAQALASRRHERRVERSADRERQDPLRAERAGEVGDALEGLGGAGDDDLAGRVEVGDPGLALGTLARGLDVVVFEAEDGDHRPGALLGGVLHRGAALGDEAQPVLEGERAGRDEGGVLAEAVPGGGRRLEAEALGGVEDDEAGHEGGELGVGGPGQRLLVGVEEQSGDVSVEDLARRARRAPRTGGPPSSRPCQGAASPGPGR